jgi:hypothetical protein
LYDSPFLVSDLIIPLDYSVPANLVQGGCVSSSGSMTVEPLTMFSVPSQSQMLTGVNTACNNPIVDTIVSVD